MRMSQEKVKDLAAQIAQLLEDHPQVHVQTPIKALQVEVGSVILDDLREEDDIDDEVDDLLEQHASDIDSESMDVQTLRKKFREQIARQRGFIL